MEKKTKQNPGNDTILSAENLSLKYRGAETHSLDNINLSIRQGDLFGLIGPNGAGKTSLISIISTLIKPSSGLLSVCGINALENPRSIRKLTGLIPQDLALYPSLTGRENLNYYGSLYGIPPKTLKQDINHYLDLFGLTEKADTYVKTYSGGMKRRINLLAGILHKPSLLLLDEPTVGIDAQSRNLIMENLMNLNKQGITMIYTSHYMEEIQKLCNRIAIIDEGHFIAEGNPDTLTRESDTCDNLSDLFLQLTGKQLRD